MVRCKNCGLEGPDEILGPTCPECNTKVGNVNRQLYVSLATRNVITVVNATVSCMIIKEK